MLDIEQRLKHVKIMKNKSLWFVCGLALVLSVMFTPSRVLATEQDPPYGNGKDGTCYETCVIFNQVKIGCWAGTKLCIETACTTGTCGYQ
jgi:hypothetical protein